MSIKSTKSTTKLNALERLLETWLAAQAKESSEAYAKSLRRPVGAFVAWCTSKGIKLSAINAQVCERYRTHCEKQGHARSTTRMSLARVQTFLRAQGVDAEALKVLRVQHTRKEKQHLADKAAERAEVAA